MEKYYNQEELDKKIIQATHLIEIEEEKLKEVIVVVYSNTETVFIYDSSGLSEEDKECFVNSLIKIIQTGCNYTRKIIAKRGNVYFIY